MRHNICVTLQTTISLRERSLTMLISNQYNQIQTNAITKTGIEAANYQTEQTDRSKHADKVSFSNQSKQMHQAEQDIASRYDVTNMTEVEKAQLANELKDKGLISGHSFAMMSFESSKAFSRLAGSEYTGDQKRDVLQDFKNELAFTLAKGGETQQGIKAREEILSILESLK